MFQVLKSIALSLALSVSVSAQWGAVTSQPDTTRFINSQQDFGLIMPHQQVIVGMLDTTITSAGTGGGNAYKVIVGSLLDYEDNCANYSITNGVASCEGSYERWRELEKSTSWYQADRGDTTAMFPTNYAITISTGQDSVNIWNRDTAELWMAFVSNGSGMVRTGVTDIKFKDGTLYVGHGEGLSSGIGLIEFLVEVRHLYFATGDIVYDGNIQQRNDVLGHTQVSTTLGIVNSNVNAVGVVRDPFGIKDALGRPKHWWVVATGGGVSTYNPHANTISNGGTLINNETLAMDSRGSFWSFYSNGSYDGVQSFWSTFSNVAGSSYDSNDFWRYDTGQYMPNWTVTHLAAAAGLSINGENAPIGFVATTAGMWILGENINSRNRVNYKSGAKQLISATVNTPVMFAETVLALALEDNTTDSSPYGNTMTANNSPSTVTAVFGKGYSSTGGNSSLTKSGATGLDGGTASFWGSLWVYPTENTNGRALTFNGDSNTDRLLIAVNVAAGSIGFQYTDDGYSTLENATWTGTVEQDKWTHIAFTRDSNAKLNVLYINGIRVATDVALNEVAASLDWDDIGVGDDVNGGGQHFYGRIDDVAYGQDWHLTDEAVAKIYAEGRKKLAMGTPVFAGDRDTGVLSDAFYSNNVVDIDALDNGMWAVAFSDANTVQVFDGRIPIQQIAAPAGTVKSVALIQSPGTDSVGVAIGTTTNLKFVQPSVNLRAAMAHQYKEPIHVGESVVVDSAGIDGIFWTAADGVVAGVNAGRTLITPLRGTYGITALSSNDYILRCSSPKNSAADLTGVLFDNGGGSTPALTISGSGVEVSNCGFRTGSGGSGGNQNAVLLSGSFINFHHNRIVDSDVSGVSITAAWSSVSYNNFTGHDGDCISLSVSGTTNNNVTNNICGDAGQLHLYTGANDNIVIGNIIDATIVDDGTNNTVSPNTIY